MYDELRYSLRRALMQDNTREASLPPATARRMAVGAEWQGEAHGVHFRVWAPRAGGVDVVFDDDTIAPCPLRHESAGYFSGRCVQARPGTRYRFRLDGGDTCGDPASRYQPEGPQGSSEVVDPDAFSWTDREWNGPDTANAVLYEMHIGTFTPEGSYAAAAAQLGWLRDLGITIVELMPLNEFNGPFGWGYDGVFLFAPTHLYGGPDALRHFVDTAHALGLAVILDVVYNHFGAKGNVLPRFSAHYVTRRYAGEWGEPLNFDGEHSQPVREFVIENAACWVREYHLDGLRIDATQGMHDASATHVLAEIAHAARAAAGARRLYLTAENEPQHSRLVRPPREGGLGLDAMWNDDFHHSATVAATGQCEAYFTPTRGTPQELVSAVKWGFLYQGQYYAWQRQPRGSFALDLPAQVFIQYLQNHDQIANGARGQRLHALTTPGRLRALTALLLLAPATPLLFQGQEFAASSPFLYFACHGPDLDPAVREGRRAFMSQFPAIGQGEGATLLADPADPATFERCKLKLDERETNGHIVQLHRDLLRLRRDDPVFSLRDSSRLHAAVLGPEAFVLRFMGNEGNERLLLVNLGAALPLVPMPEPLLSPPRQGRWSLLWHSEHPDYRGSGMAQIDRGTDWHLPAHAAAVLAPNLQEQDHG